MEHITAKGLVIRETPFGEADCYITVLTEKLGKIEVLCRGVRRKKGRMANAVRVFCYSELTLYCSGRRYTLNDASVEMQFWRITEDIEKCALAYYLVQVAGLIADSDDDMPELLPTLLRALYALEKQNRSVHVVKPAFELRAACLAGYQPNLGACAVCGSGEGTPSFLLEEGVLVCPSCRTRVGGTYLPLTGGVLEAMRYIIGCEGRRLFAFSVNAETARQLEIVCERHLMYHLEQKCSALEFYHSLFPKTGAEETT
ncbi:MAG: DNA repair protein RecO [Butyricicoccaceae bacterium]